MNSGVRKGLVLLFSGILVAMLAVTTWASRRVALWNAWPNGPDPWSIATLFDAYFGFVTFAVWAVYKEVRWSGRIVWLFLIFTLGNIAMSVYVLRELYRLGDRPIADLLVRPKA